MIKIILIYGSQNPPPRGSGAPPLTGRLN